MTGTEPSLILTHRDGKAFVYDLPGRQRRVVVKSDKYVPLETCITTYTDDLIKLTLEVHGLPYLAEAIARDEEPSFIQGEIESNLFDFYPPEMFKGRRLLDFGCGSGASTVCMARLLPETELLGVELQGHLQRLAEARKNHHGLSNARFLLSPSGNELPEGIGQFDFCMMSAVFEHLLPDERQTVLPAIWNALKPGGVLFINQTPHRWFPIETHSSGLPFINYLPEALAFPLARRFSRVAPMKGHMREQLLRGGLRGATEFEIMGIVSKHSEYEAALLEPLRGDRIDLWHARLSPRFRTLKLGIKWGMKALRLLTGQVVTQNLTLAIVKSKLPRLVESSTR